MSEDTQKISKNREKKIAVVAELNQKFEKANAVVFTNYAGLTHKQIEALKKELKKAEAEFVVAKNSLLTRATDKKLEGEHELGGQTGTLFLYNDIVSPLKELAKTIKELNLPNIKFGIMEGNFITADQVTKLATLPTREVLLTQLAFGLKAPISNLHRALNWNLQKLVMTLNAVVQAKPADSAPAPQPVAEPATPQQQEPTENPVPEPTAQDTQSGEAVEPETIAAETKEEKLAEQPSAEEVAQTENQDTNDEGGEN